jgi:hypothetical protein
VQAENRQGAQGRVRRGDGRRPSCPLRRGSRSETAADPSPARRHSRPDQRMGGASPQGRSRDDLALELPANAGNLGQPAGVRRRKRGGAQTGYAGRLDGASCASDRGGGRAARGPLADRRRGRAHDWRRSCCAC